MSVIRQHYEGYDRFEGLKDEDIVRYIQATKDEIAIDFLVEKYKNFVREMEDTNITADVTVLQLGRGEPEWATEEELDCLMEYQEELEEV